MDFRPGGLTPWAASLHWSGPQGRPGDIHFVMPGLVPGIPILRAQRFSHRDGRDKPGHDGGGLSQVPKPRGRESTA
ncbi:MAG TPA: hypothetical protein VE423_10275, partial [Microvirga sp.]|nr:hypothetical protein [Microvirga sp.]